MRKKSEATEEKSKLNKEAEEQNKLIKSAEIALSEYMGLSSDETLLILTDDKLNNIGKVLYDVGKTLCEEAFYFEMKARETNGQEPPEPIAELMKGVDVVVCPTFKSLTHTNARREASRLGVRIGTMPGITAEIMERCFSAKPEKIVELTDYLLHKLIKTANVRITTKAGTDITLPIKGRRIIPSTGVLRNIGESGNLPSGEVYCAPWEKKSNGKVVFDGSFAEIGLLENPITIVIKNGYATSIQGDKEAEQLNTLLKKHGKDAHAVAEFGIGTNYKAKLSGKILEDEKVMGTVHIAFGNNLSMGGKIAVPLHVDGLIKKPTVYFDNELIMKEGKFVRDE